VGGETSTRMFDVGYALSNADRTGDIVDDKEDSVLVGDGDEKYFETE
jgi:hypothetical protein